MHNSLPTTLLHNPYTYKKNNFLRHISAKYTASHDKFLKNAANNPVSSYGIKGNKQLQKISNHTFEIKRARNEKSLYFRPYTAPSKEHILLNQHLLKTQDFKEILKDRQIKTSEDNPLDSLYFEDISLSKHNNDCIKTNDDAFNLKKNNIFKKYEGKELLNISKNSDFHKFSPNNHEKKNKAFNFMTSVDVKEHIPQNFPTRPLSSQLRKRKISTPSYSS